MPLQRVMSSELLKTVATQATNIRALKSSIKKAEQDNKRVEDSYKAMQQNPQGTATQVQAFLSSFSQPNNNSPLSEYAKASMQSEAATNHEISQTLGEGLPTKRFSERMQDMNALISSSSSQQLAQMAQTAKSVGLKHVNSKKQKLKEAMDTVKESLFPQLRKMSTVSQEKIPTEIKPAFQIWKRLNPSPPHSRKSSPSPSRGKQNS